MYGTMYSHFITSISDVLEYNTINTLKNKLMLFILFIRDEM